MEHVYVLLSDNSDNIHANDCVLGVFREHYGAKQAMKEYVKENYTENEHTKFKKDWKKNYHNGVYDMGSANGYLEILKMSVQ